MAELQELRVRYLQLGWQTAIGSSGSILAIADICQQLGWVEKDIDAAAVVRLRDRILEFERIEDVQLPGLSEQRQPVLAGGLVMLNACFNVLGIEHMKPSPFALREGVLHDLLGRLDNHDPRENTIQAFKSRHHADAGQVERVRRTALSAFGQIEAETHLRGIHRQMLSWAADLHEVGLGVSHSHYQQHSGYLVQNSDMAGFTQQEQLFLATLVRYHRREIARDFARPLPSRLHEALRYTLFCLRLACIFCRSRDDAAIPDFRLSGSAGRFELDLDTEWRREHPLTMADLHRETQALRTIGLQCSLKGEETQIGS
jgi:exopolyphosphatase/guanosine-5'-triphosphate,3'-diphosphate pyrophosphatase